VAYAALEEERHVGQHVAHGVGEAGVEGVAPQHFPQGHAEGSEHLEAARGRRPLDVPRQVLSSSSSASSSLSSSPSPSKSWAREALARGVARVDEHHGSTGSSFGGPLSTSVGKPVSL
jgi:hypothetical protein